LYYQATGTGGAALRLTLTAVPVVTGTSLSIGTPVAVGTLSNGSRGYDVAPDGRILLNQPANASASTGTIQRIVVVRNWLSDVKARVLH